MRVGLRGDETVVLPDRNSLRMLVLPLAEPAHVRVEVEALVHEVGDLVAAQDMVLRDLADGMADGELLGEDDMDALAGRVTMLGLAP